MWDFERERETESTSAGCMSYIWVGNMKGRQRVIFGSVS